MNVESCCHDDAVTILKNAGDSVVLIVKYFEPASGLLSLKGRRLMPCWPRLEEREPDIPHGHLPSRTCSPGQFPLRTFPRCRPRAFLPFRVSAAAFLHLRPPDCNLYTFIPNTSTDCEQGGMSSAGRKGRGNVRRGLGNCPAGKCPGGSSVQEEPRRLVFARTTSEICSRRQCHVHHLLPLSQFGY